MIMIKMTNITSRLVWHPKGDYLGTMAHNVQLSSQVLIHSLSKASTMKPFGAAKGII